MTPSRRKDRLASTYIFCVKLHDFQAVHKELELELGLKQVQVVTTSQEERWALRQV